MLGSVEDDVVKRDDGDRVRARLHEIADRLDVPLGTVKGRMRLALEKARAEIVFEDNHNRS